MEFLENRKTALARLNREIVACRLCPRLVEHRERVALNKRAAYQSCEYWAKPVPGFGDPSARVLLLGLAPGAHGSNRTGRMFTGDGSGIFLYRVLHRAGYSNQPTAARVGDGLRLSGAYITAAARCAPPDNKPTPAELKNCADFLAREMALLPNLRVVVALGKVAWDAYLAWRKNSGKAAPSPKPAFGHGAEVDLGDGPILLGSYHPSQQNTFTGKLTEKQMLAVLRRAQKFSNRAPALGPPADPFRRRHGGGARRQKD
ncbi:MAG: uracil-DNA glycosylase [Elusimicrobia bacterium]|nr:uracil-DNA glycosylase [Elusimicrobiota bacterium]